MKDYYEKCVSQGLKIIILGCCLLIGELLLLPIYAFLEKIRTGGSNVVTKWIEYASVKPMPLVFTITIIILLIGVVHLMNGLKHKNKI